MSHISLKHKYWVVDSRSYVQLLLCGMVLVVLLSLCRIYSSEFLDHWRFLPAAFGMGVIFLWKMSQVRSVVRFGVILMSIAFVFSLLLMHITWEPFLSQYYSTKGYFASFDPARIYVYSRILFENDFSHTIWWDFSGIFYVYAAFMWLSSTDPYAFTVIHYFILGLGVVHLLQTLERSGGNLDKRLYWLVFGVFLLPEVFYFMNASSKDTILLILITWITSLLLRLGFYKFNIFNFIAVILLSFIAASIRGSMIFMVGVCVYAVIWVKSNWSRRILYGLLIILAGVLMTNLSAGVALLDFQEYFETKSSGDTALSHSYDQSSVSAALITDNLFFRVMFIPVRVVVSWLAPLLDNPFFSKDFFGSYSPMLMLCSFITSVLFLFTIPLAIGHTIRTIWSKRKNKVELALVYIFILMEVAVANGIQIVHPRYRIMLSVLLWIMIVKGLTVETKLLKTVYFLWFALLILGGATYLTYKMSLV